MVRHCWGPDKWETLGAGVEQTIVNSGFDVRHLLVRARCFKVRCRSKACYTVQNGCASCREQLTRYVLCEKGRTWKVDGNKECAAAVTVVNTSRFSDVLLIVLVNRLNATALARMRVQCQCWTPSKVYSDGSTAATMRPLTCAAHLS